MSRTVPRTRSAGSRRRGWRPSGQGDRAAVAAGWPWACVVVVAAGAVWAWRAGVFSPAASSGAGQHGAPAPATAVVTRQDLSATTPVTATLGYSGSYTVTGQGGGTLTWLPSPGQVIRQGQALYQTGNGVPGGRCCTAACRTGGPWTRGSPARTCPSSTTTWWTSATPTGRMSSRWAGITTRGRRRTECSSWKSAWGSPGRRGRCRWGRWCSSRGRCGSAR